MEPVSIALIIGIVTLVIIKVFKFMAKIKKSSCCKGKVELETRP